MRGLACNTFPSARRRGFTLSEVMVATSLFMILLIGILACYLYGLKMSAVAQIKLSATADARKSLTLLLEDIRAAQTVRVGTGSLTSFTEVADNTNQQGDSIQICKTLNTNDWIRYYYVPANNSLCRTEDGVNASLVTANSITNDTPLFSLEDFTANINTNKQLSPVVEVNLSFTQLKDPSVVIGPGNYFDFYHFQTRITPRVRQ